MSEQISGSIYLCVKQFNSRLGDELNLKIGDKVEVLADDSEYNDGWYMGRNLLTNDVGLYPKTFTQLLHTPKNPDTLLRLRSRRVATPPNSNSLTNVSKLVDEMNGLTVEKGSGGSGYSNNNSNSNGAIRKSSGGMTEIDKALQELQNSPKQPGKGIIPGVLPKNGSFSNGASNKSSNKGSNAGTPNGTVENLPSNNSSVNGNRLSTQSLTDLDPLDALNWTPQQVSTYFAMILGFDLGVAGKFARHKITGTILFELDLAHLKELDIDSFGTRFEIYKEIEKLKKGISGGVEVRTPGQTPGRPGAAAPAADSVVDDEPSPSTSKFLLPQKSFPYGGKSAGAPEDTSNYSDSFNTTSNSLTQSNLNNTTFISQQNKSTSQLMPSAPLTSSDNVGRTGSRAGEVYLKHQRKRSQSMDNISSRPSPPPQNDSYNDDEEISTPDKRKSMAFLSPRKAPIPPSAPSPLNKTYKFGGATSNNNNGDSETSGHMYMTRTNASNAGLGISNFNGLSRPASSIYDNSIISHGRKESQNSNGLGHHRRNSSQVSGGGNTHHRRHSSLFLFLSTNEDLSLNGEKTPKQGGQSNGGGSTPQNNRNSSFFGSAPRDLESGDYFKSKNITSNALISPANINPETPAGRSTKNSDLSPVEAIDIDKATLSPKKLKSVSYRGLGQKNSDKKLGAAGAAPAPPLAALDDEKRSASDSTAISRLKTLRTTSTQNFKNITSLKKLKTSAFQEGIRQITPDDAIKQATYSGWMSKKSGGNIGWRSRYFTLHGTRLLYFTSLKDKKERGLIDITAHKVIPINTDDSNNSNDKYVAMYASSTGFGRYCFKIVPPAPGFKKGLTFTQPKTHYFAVETQEDMRGWLKALMTATIDIDDTVPVVSSCSTPTVTLGRAQELLAKAREETKLKDEELRAQGYFREGGYDYTQEQQQLSLTQDPKQQYLIDSDFTSEENSPVINTDQMGRLPSLNRRGTGGAGSSIGGGQPSLSVDTNPSRQPSSSSMSKTPTTPQFSNQGGFASPYLLASGLLSPKSGNGSMLRDSRDLSGPSIRDSTGTRESGERERERISQLIQSANTSSSNITQSPASSQGNKTQDYLPTGETTPKLIFLNSNGRIVSGSKKKAINGEKMMMAYSNDGSGNHTFSIKPKKQN